MRQTEIDIVGAGIGGLTAACALGARGHRVRVHERAPELRAAGAGIIMQPNAMRVFDAIDPALGRAVREAGHALASMSILDMSGRPSSLMPTPEGHDSVTIDRATLLHVLAEYMSAELVTSSDVTGVVERDGALELERASGGALRTDAVVGADGIHSRIRESLLGPVELRYAGYTVWRGMTDWRHDALGEGAGEYWGPHKRFGMVPLVGGRTYWYAVEDAPEGERDGEDPAAEIAARFEGWDPACAEMCRRTPNDAIMRHDCHDIAPLETWGKGRVTLLGDAAHAMTPNMGQGGCQAVESALALALALDEHDDVEAAWRAYEDARRARAHEFVRRSWSIGVLSQWESGLARGVRDLGMRWTPDWVMRRQVERMYRPTGL